MRKWSWKRLAILLCLLWLGVHATQVFSFTVNEATDGDLSGIEPFPTALVLELGTNTLVGSAGIGDFDIFRFSVLPNTVLTSITVDSYQPNAGISFIGMQVGTQWTAGKGNGIDGSALAGWTLFGANNVTAASDLLLTMSTAGSGAAGFNVPLGVGDYVFLIQDTGESVSYGLNFTASPVPLPASLPLLGFALLGLRRRKSRR